MNALSANFTGISGALVMAAIAMSIVFIIITGLMFLMMGLHEAVAAADKTRASDGGAPAARKES